MTFLIGLHQPHDARHFPRCFISINRLRHRKSGSKVRDWILDSGAFTELAQHGRYRHEPEEYAQEIIRWAENGNLLAAITQDFLCESVMLAKTGLDVATHQRLTIERYDRIRAAVPMHIHVMPVLQGYAPEEYVEHVHQYGERLSFGMWVGVGSVCKRNGDPAAIEAVLGAIKKARPDLRLHGFGLKRTALSSKRVCSWLWSADSLAWSFAARRQGRDGNSWQEAARYVQQGQARAA